MIIVALGLCYLAWAGYLSRTTLLQRVQDEGELVVVTRVSPATYLETQNGATGLEYDLARLFAQELGVELRIVKAGSLDDIFSLVARRQVHLGAAGITVTPERERRFRFTEPYMSVQQQLVYREGSRRPQHLGDLGEGELRVLAHSSHAEFLKTAQRDFPQLRWGETSQQRLDDLLYDVWSGRLTYTVADSSELALHRGFYPELRAAFDITEPQGLAWVFPKSGDESLYKAATAFFDRIRTDGTLTHLLERYYGHLGRFDYVGTRTFMRHITERLPQYRPLFEEAAAEYGLDWRLLAAIGYQESHWDPRAVSPTGVRGLMMLTMNTARMLGVQNRLDPAQSIFGGARYFAEVRARLPERLQEPTRTWLALAAYNVGYGHLEDARRLTQRRGGDPDAWRDVKQNLPLLSKPEWYRQTRYGYARGWEPVRYVENVRTYYELLIRVTEPELLQVSSELPSVPPPPRHTGSSGNGLHIGDVIESAF